jgi:hypothetical protein
MHALMRRLIEYFSLRCLGWLALSLTLPGTALSGSEPTNAAPKAVLHQSIFVDDVKTGRDPFFPNTARRAEKVPLATTQPDGSLPNVAKVPFEQVKLKGILGNSWRRLALINNHTFEVGEQAEVKTNDGRIKVRCLEIRDRSVIVNLAGENQRRELHLNEKL